MTLSEKVIVSLIIMIMVGLVVGFVNTKMSFKAVCDGVGGTTVFDGRQYQCFKGDVNEHR